MKTVSKNPGKGPVDRLPMMSQRKKTGRRSLEVPNNAYHPLESPCRLRK
ncbi:hypothetical protein [Azospirillum endophyticum]